MERIATRAPVDGTAARVTSKGFDYTPDKKIAQLHWETCPKTKDVPKDMPVDKVLTGRKFGRFTVIGLYPKKGRANKGRWVCRCACGRYETRTRRAITNPQNTDDCCCLCRHLKHLQREDKRRKEREAAAATDTKSEVKEE